MVAIESNIPDATPCLDDGPIDRAKNLTHSLAGGDASGDPCPAQASEESVEIPSVSSAHDTISTSRSSGKPSDDPTTSASRVVLSPASSSSSPSTSSSSSSSSCGSSKRASLNSSRGIASDTTHFASGDSANASSPGGSRRVSAESSSNNSSDFSSSGSGSPISSPDPVNKNARHGTSTNPKNRKRPKKQKEKPKKSTPSRDMPQIFPFASWMTDNFDAIGYRRLNEILLPGTHNSGTYTLMHTSDYAEDLPALQKCNPVWPVSLTIANFSRTQKRTISEQLHDGIRYLDIRICNYRNQFYLCHGMRAITLADLLGSIAIFAREHPREVVIVDFNHFYNMGEEKHLELQKKIAYAFHGILFPHSFLELTLQEAFAQGSGNIAVIYHKPFAKSYPFFPGDAIQSPWANTCSVRELKVRLLQSQQLFAPTAGPGLFVTQFIVTPPVPTILSGIMRPGTQHSLSGLARRLNKRVMLWIDEFLREGLAMNIAMIDHHHNCDFVKLIVDLNRQRAFKGSTAASSAEPSAASAKPIAVGR